MLGRLAVVLCLAGCFSKPGPPSAVADANGDTPTDQAPVTPMVPRLIAEAYHSGGDQQPETLWQLSANMTPQAFWIPTHDAIHDGDLVLMIATGDNGSQSEPVFANPIASGFTQAAQIYQVGDGQSIAVDWKIAGAAEAGHYNGPYNNPGSGSAVIALIAISGAAGNPQVVMEQGAEANPATGNASGLTSPEGATLLYASGADWHPEEGSATWMLPDNYTMLEELGDRGSPLFRWSEQMIAYHLNQPAGVTGGVSGMTGNTASTHTGKAWTALIAVAPL